MRDSPSLSHGVRAIHDLTLPRIHMDVTVCGAVPPFSRALGGKLVVAFLGHPLVRAASGASPGTILEHLFDVDILGELLPRWGLLAVTTKGLYPLHAALYNRADIPGSSGPLRLKKIGETKGETTTFLSLRTGKCARRLLEAEAGGRRVALAYGTGGAKRHRILESAALAAGLAEEVVHAGIRRPIYGVQFVDNLEAVVWMIEAPRWRIDADVSSQRYSELATALWRARWLSKAVARTGDTDHIVPGPFETSLAESS